MPQNTLNDKSLLIQMIADGPLPEPMLTQILSQYVSLGHNELNSSMADKTVCLTTLLSLCICVKYILDTWVKEHYVMFSQYYE